MNNNYLEFDDVSFAITINGDCVEAALFEIFPGPHDVENCLQQLEAKYNLPIGSTPIYCGVVE